MTVSEAKKVEDRTTVLPLEVVVAQVGMESVERAFLESGGQVSLGEDSDFGMKENGGGRHRVCRTRVVVV